MSIETLTGLFDLLPTCSLKDEPEAMKKMPPLPDKLNEEMINSILHPLLAPPQGSHESMTMMCT
ncbi:hypothetical protein CK203_033006 [Vitis vinifera]|uniref:Uncharacterized protein n=1 Tax=Vitis vinifera TaxID=29760 RepID=A0A438HVV8_VITVI|nr:hypothetical protein CK203_033006 [Vitis vinifera]